MRTSSAGALRSQHPLQPFRDRYGDLGRGAGATWWWGWSWPSPGGALPSGRTWARAAAITRALRSAIANFLFIPYYPFWSLLIITLDVFVIWAIAAHGGAMRDARP